MRIAAAALFGMATVTAACSGNPAPVAPSPQPAPPAAVAARPAAAPTPAPAPPPAPAPAPAAAVDLSGAWGVNLDMQGQTIVVDVNLARGPNGYTGDAAPQGQAGAPLSSLTLRGDTLTMTFSAPEGEAVFVGTMSADRRAVAGTLTYQGQSLPFTMTKR